MDGPEFKDPMRKLLPLILLLFLAACEKKQPTQEYFVDVQNVVGISLDEVLRYAEEKYGDVASNVIDEHRTEVEEYRNVVKTPVACSITYRTVAPDGKEVIASGVVYVPRTPKIDGVVEIMPISRCKTDCITEAPVAFDCLCAFLGYICLSTDQIGTGTTEDLPLNIFQNQNIARVCADFRKAAAEYLKKYWGILLPSNTIIWGYSMGGTSSLALARYYDTHPEDGVRIKRLYTGGGAYKLDYVLKTMIGKGKNRYGILPALLWNFDQWEGTGMNPEDVFLPWLLAREDIYKGYIPYFPAGDILGDDLSGYLNMDYFEDSNPIFANFLRHAAQKEVPIDWTPTYPVDIICVVNDDVVPPECTKWLYEDLKARGAEIEYTETEDDHITTGGSYMAKLVYSLM